MTALLGLLCLLPGFEKELRLLPLLLRPGYVCVDIGASLGVYAIPMAMLVGASGAVVAFEPRLRAASRLRRLGQALGLRALQVDVEALGRAPGQSQLVIPGRRRLVPGRSYLASNTVCSALDDRLVPHTTLDVAVTTLDATRAALGKPIDFVKCDVEGAEMDVFVGGQSVLSQDRPVVLCEIEQRHTRRYGHTVEDVHALFHEYDYGRVDLVAAPTGSTRNILLVPRERTPHLPQRLRQAMCDAVPAHQ